MAMMRENFPETARGWARLKTALSNLAREVRLSIAQWHASRAMFMYLRNGMPDTSMLIAAALSHSLQEEEIRRQRQAAKDGA